ncbi:hypothetical protein QUN99_003343 [Vibrio parahaemolyticus]|nr:hypothetical protein [Vibrio parahaemolyticus]
MKRVSAVKRGNLTVSAGLKLNGSMTKDIKFGKQSYTARHVIVPAKDVEAKTIAHHLNLRNQDSLTLEAVRDIYQEVVEEGVKQEGVAYYNAELDRYELFDASRRRFCAIEAKVELPLWVIDEQPEAKDIEAYVNLTQKVKLFSWREVGAKYLKHANEMGIDADDFERIGLEFGVSGETVRKKVNAARLNEQLVESFPDSQGIPTSFYAKLAKIERTLAKSNHSIEEFVANESKAFITNTSDVGGIQAELLAYYEEKLVEISNDKPKPQAKIENLAVFESKDMYARLKTSANGRIKSLEFSRLPKELMDEIEAFVRKRLAENQ